jgi:hypothetical protein
MPLLVLSQQITSHTIHLSGLSCSSCCITAAELVCVNYNHQSTLRRSFALPRQSIPNTMPNDSRYESLIKHLVAIRKQTNTSVEALSASLGVDATTVADVEALKLKLDIVELHNWLTAFGYSHQAFLTEIGWLKGDTNGNLPALPIRGGAKSHSVPATAQNVAVSGTLIGMDWRGQRKDIFIANMPVDGYLALEAEISAIYKSLNNGNGGKNRQAILHALTTAIERFPNANPSDIYHHIVYRHYLRDYNKTQADRSWVRAGGEAFELFLEAHYNKILAPHDISLQWLSNNNLKSSALSEMGIQNEVGGSKLDIALYGTINGRQVIFGGIHAKASLAERVSDDVPCSEAMMRKGLSSYLVTFDAKSFPPPVGDLVNRGELGTLDAPSDKRAYIESHGSFTACFSYNLRTTPSGASTTSGRKIFVSTFNPQTDLLPKTIQTAWTEYQKSHLKR